MRLTLLEIAFALGCGIALEDADFIEVARSRFAVGIGNAALLAAHRRDRRDASRPGASQHPPGDIQQEALAQTIIPGDEVEPRRKFDRTEHLGRAYAAEHEAFQHE